jgi:hypothetical protein
MSANSTTALPDPVGAELKQVLRALKLGKSVLM